MAEKFKVGDKIRRKQGYWFTGIDEVEIIKIKLEEPIGHRLTIRDSSGKKDVWHGQYCELVEKEEEQEKLCCCDIQILMRQGCQCGCKI